MTKAHGIPLAIVIDGANRHDMKRVKQTLDHVQLNRPLPVSALPEGLCLGKGVDYDEVRALVAQFGFTAQIRSRGKEARQIKQEAGFRARRWAIERPPS
jgi:putative transposase